MLGGAQRRKLTLCFLLIGKEGSWCLEARRWDGSTLRPRPPSSSGSALRAVELASSGNLCSCSAWPDGAFNSTPEPRFSLLSFLLIQPARLSPPLFSPPLCLESSPGFPAANSFCCLLGSLPSSAPASPVPAVCSAPRLCPSPATRAAPLAQSGRSSPDLSASRPGCEFQQLARRRQRLARVPLGRLVSPRLAGRKRPGSPWSPSEDNAPGAGPPSRALVRARLLPAAPRRRPAPAPLPPGGLLPRPERLGRQQHQHQHQPRGGRRQTRRGRRLPEQQHRRGARGRRRQH